MTVEIQAGQKSGTFLDLRALRKWLSLRELSNRRVLNLFSYTGTLGLACEVAGAREVWNVDVSEGALSAAKKHHTLGRAKFVTADIFDWFPSLPDRERFDLVIVDPPSMAAKMDHVKTALNSYRRLYALAARHLMPGGVVVVCCCTSRISRKEFERVADAAFATNFKKIADLRPEDDHPVGFREGDYLKILAYQLKRG